MTKTPRHRMSCAAILFVLVHSANPLSTSPALQQRQPPALAGDWAGTKAALRSPDCCVVSVSGLESHLRALQAQWADEPSDLDLRARIRVRSSARADCLRVRRSVSTLAGDDDGEADGEKDDSDDGGVIAQTDADPCTAALEELARGVASLADGPLEGTCEDVFVRIACASNYRARDPPFHTDKAPLRGYVTLRGLGTEFMTRPCTPVEYMTLRTLGSDGGEPMKDVRQAEELEFIVMKGDYYEAPPAAVPTSSGASWLNGLWQRASACVHRSPPTATTTGKNMGRRRVIVSFDLADGDDDREWYQSGTKREWRNGMTQRKSRLVA